ncbi:Sulfate permease 2 [Massospora cicadina]|nr:Sulfate permease 2 [Massospora cicadina]
MWYEIRRYHHLETPSEWAHRWWDGLLINWYDLLSSFVPSLNWVPKYRRDWLVGDLVAGFTVGVMMVPQSVAYARLAQLPVQFGLYASFGSAIVYALVGGSREIAVGPNAVLSLTVAEAVRGILAKGAGYPPERVAAALATVLALVSIALGGLRFGILLELIPSPVIMGFTAGAACTIVVSQVQAMVGITGIDTTELPWEVVGEVFRKLNLISTPDAIMGISTLIFLLVVQILATRLQWRVLSYLAVGANAIAVVLFTLVSSLVLKLKPEAGLAIVGDVPSGFGHVGVPWVGVGLWRDMLGYAPGLFLVAILEHAAVCKNFSRRVGYAVSISQEFFAVGVANLVGSLFSGFPVAGSLSRGAVLARSGVRTPMAGVLVGVVLLGALKLMTPAFYYIPTASLGAIITRAGLSLLPHVGDLRELWATNKVDWLVLVVAALMTFLFGVQYGIGSSVAISFAYLVLRIARPKCYVLGEVVGRRGVFVDKRHPAYASQDPEPGVVVFRVQESVLFPNIAYLRQQLMDHVCEFTRCGAPQSQGRLWSWDVHERAIHLRNLRAARTGEPSLKPDSLPYLRAVILDFGAVNHIDASGIQGLKELRDQLYRVLRALVISGLTTRLIPNQGSPSQSSYFTNPSEISEDQPSTVEVTEDTSETQPKGLNGAVWQAPHYELTPHLLANQIEPIVLNSNPYIHLTTHNAVESFRMRYPSRLSPSPTLSSNSIQLA